VLSCDALDAFVAFGRALRDELHLVASAHAAAAAAVSDMARRTADEVADAADAKAAPSERAGPDGGMAVVSLDAGVEAGVAQALRTYAGAATCVLVVAEAHAARAFIAAPLPPTAAAQLDSSGT
jgi:hypothetical protein